MIEAGGVQLPAGVGFHHLGGSEGMQFHRQFCQGVLLCPPCLQVSYLAAPPCPNALQPPFLRQRLVAMSAAWSSTLSLKALVP